MNLIQPTVSGKELQKRKLQAMAETVPHFKEVSGMKILIHPNVYPPGTDTHLLANTVKVKPGDKTLDLCTGTGVIAIKMAQQGAASVIGVDLNPRAIENAKENKKLLNLENVEFREGDMFEGINGKFDVVAINPPYTDSPATNDIDICFYDEGHQFLKKFFAGLDKHLKSNGTAYIAWSNIGKMDVLPNFAKEYGFKLNPIAEDVGGRGYTFYVYALTKDENDN